MRSLVLVVLLQLSFFAHAEYPNVEKLTVNQSLCMGFKIWVFGGRAIQASFPETIENRKATSVIILLSQDGRVLHTSVNDFNRHEDKPHTTLTVRDELTPNLDIALEITYSCRDCGKPERIYIIPSVYEYKYARDSSCTD